MTTLKEIFYVQSLWDDSILVDNLERKDIQSGLNEAVAIQRSLEKYRDKPTFMLKCRVVEVKSE